MHRPVGRLLQGASSGLAGSGRLPCSSGRGEDAPVDVPETRTPRPRTWIHRAAGRLARIGVGPEDVEELREKKKLLVLLAVLILPVSVVWGSVYLAFGSPVGIVPYIYFAISIGSLVLFARTRNFRLLLVIQLLDILLTTTAGQMLVGGFLPSGGVGLWGVLAPLGALVFLDVRQAIRWFVAFVFVFLLLGIAGEVLFPDADLPIWFTSTMLALNVIGTGSIVFTLLATFANQRNAALAALRVEQQKSESLLMNILPSSIAERLKAANEPIADHFASASILFADVVDFTPLAQRLPPAEVVGILDQLFSRFDALVERHGLEKIKTIGDCYMAAAGVPDPLPDHARKTALLALDMRDTVATSALAGQSGVGDAVNTASRMESQSTPGEIQITRATYELLKDEFVCRRRGTILVKGKGEMETWYLVGSRSDRRRTERGIESEAAGARRQDRT